MKEQQIEQLSYYEQIKAEYNKALMLLNELKEKNKNEVQSQNG